jgi:hypothetical protein
VHNAISLDFEMAMLKTSFLSSPDCGDCNWTEDELVRLEAHANGLPPWEPPPNLGAQSSAASPKLPWKTSVVRELDGMDAKKVWFLAVLEDWTTAAKASRDQDATARKALKGNDRLHAHRRAELEGLARYYREHPRADVAPGLFSLIVLLSDNDEYGACYLSISRMAEVLSRTPDSIRDALRRLVAAGIIGTEERRGDSTLCWPLLHTSFGDKPSLHWLVEYYSPRRELGRPRKNPLPVEGEPISGNPLGVEGEGVSENPSPPPARKPLPLHLETTLLLILLKRKRETLARLPSRQLATSITQQPRLTAGQSAGR